MALQARLDKPIAATEGARNEMAVIEEESTQDIEAARKAQ